jgi:diaminohydroxyphosphoribosylaminopyrimidine deaminase/5-amino-6-(5-phosphoribosylamino)uracil reductase
MRVALNLARRGYGKTSPNPMVGALLVKSGRIIGQGWHHQAGKPHAEIEALRDAERRGHSVQGATLYVTLEPCSTHGRTPPCTDAIIAAGISKVFIGAKDPNPNHEGRGLKLLASHRIKVACGILGNEATSLNEPFNHWIVKQTPFVTVKAAMTLDGKIATVSGESKWITNTLSRRIGMKLRQGHDAVLVGVNTVLADNPQLTVRSSTRIAKCPLRIILDSRARTPLHARVLSDQFADRTIVVVAKHAPPARVRNLMQQVQVWEAPERNGFIDLKWLLQRLGNQQITSLLVEGGGEVNASFLLQRLAQRVAFFYAPIVLGGARSIKAVAGKGLGRGDDILQLEEVNYQRLGQDLLMTARLV